MFVVSASNLHVALSCPHIARFGGLNSTFPFTHTLNGTDVPTGIRGYVTSSGTDPAITSRLPQLCMSLGCSPTFVNTVTKAVPVYPSSGPLGELMFEDYRRIISSLAPKVGPFWSMDEQTFINWGNEVLKECVKIKANMTFYAVSARKDTEV